ncbi:MAG TPA: polysaccharide biosynthesis/export family protein [Blastocatellia bacterium]|jgi:polysaccharide export outer membrane protein|nr:polysaccharide biosynthesis/export family protein [Blastocatellia bacterium]
MTKRIMSLAMIAFASLYVCAPAIAAQSVSKLADARPLNTVGPVSSPDEAAIQAQINSVYQNFYTSYRLGPGDLIGIYIDKHPEDSVERVAVSPVGKIYFPLLGNVTVVGKTLPQLQEYFSTAVAEFIKEPRVTLSLLEAQSAKIGILGDVRSPGLMIMTRPLRVLDAITQAGGILETGSQSVSILRQYEDGRVQMLSVDVKRILKGKASPEENAYLRAGDTIIVHGNLFKKVGKLTSMMGVTGLVTFLMRGGR